MSVIQDPELTANRIVVRDIPTLSRFTVAEHGAALPVELASFLGVRTAEGVRLNWVTASEDRNAGFRVQRTAQVLGEEGTRWANVGFVEGAGTSDATNAYQFEDTDGLSRAGKLHYRLKQIDTDGLSRVLDTVSVPSAGPDTLRLSGPTPNPVIDAGYLRVFVPSEAASTPATIELYDMMGRRVFNKREEVYPGTNALRIGVPRLVPNLYILRVQVGGLLETTRFTVVD